MTGKFNVNLDILISNNLSLEGYFILWCLNTKNESSLLDYTRSCRKIPTEIFDILEQQQFITIARQQLQDNKITYSSLTITQSGKQLFDVQDFDKLFEELKEAYPKTAGKTGRRLHQDLKRCKVLYKKIINDNIELHKNICKSALIYHQEKLKTNSEDYLQLLATWLHQENYNEYLEEAKNSTLKTVTEQTNITSI